MNATPEPGRAPDLRQAKRYPQLVPRRPLAAGGLEGGDIGVHGLVRGTAEGIPRVAESRPDEAFELGLSPPLDMAQEIGFQARTPSIIPNWTLRT